MDVQMALNGGLLLGGQVVVGDVGAADVVLLDDVLPRILGTAIGQVEILDVVVRKAGILFCGVAKCFLAGATPSAPDV